MPLYEYICQTCGERFEVIRPMSERTQPAACPRCASPQTQLALSSSAFLGGSSAGGCGTNAWTGGG